MSIEVALQSVAFYVLSCSTCAKISHRRKAKIQAKKERAEKHALETEQPGLYRHPSPFSTNPYWDEEITMGPGPPKKKAEKNCSQAALNPAGAASSYANSSTMSTGTGTASSPTAIEGSRTSGEGWNLKRYQREDEALWGHDTPGPGQRIFDAIARAGSTAGRLLEGRLNKSTASEEENHTPQPYYLARNPPVNDLHPPVVSTKPASRDETRWMLQPPPPAKVMEGKERVNRTRAVSAGSSRRGPDGSPLSRPVTERLDEVKEQRIETNQPSEGALTSHQPVPAPGLLDTNIQRPVSPLSISTGTDAEGKPKPRKENKGPTALRELSPVSSNSTMNSRASTSNRLSPNANSMPVTISSADSKFASITAPAFPKPAALHSTGRTGLGIELETAKA